MTATANQKAIGGFKAKRRRFIKRSGKKLIRGLAGFLGRQSKVGDRPIHANEDFSFLAPFTENAEAILAEANSILKHREDIPAFHDISPDQMKISKGTGWRTFFLFGFGQRLERNCSQAPVTARLLERVPHLQTAWFSILAPRYHIPAHRGVTKGILRAHLGLVIPQKAEDCYIRVGDQIKIWRKGQIFVMDDTYEHEVYNNTDDERVVLIFDFDRPMRFWGRTLNTSFLRLMKLTAYYQDPKRNLMSFEERFEAATKRNQDNYEKLSDHG
jgi:ornithine lipid ester-linked acyl 2-hydroxylase